VRSILNFKRYDKEVVLACFKTLMSTFVERLRKIMKDLKIASFTLEMDRHLPGRYFVYTVCIDELFHNQNNTS
jgi:hypothetical protein